LLLCVVELATLTRVDGKTIIRVLSATEVDGLVKKYQDEVEAKKREKEKAEASKME
jgi:20S proteasome subunit alpha 3